MEFSPLFWPVRLKGRSIFVLDETQLPQKLAYIKLKDCRQAVRAIRQMKTRAVGQVLLVMYVFLLLVRKNRKKRNLLPVLKKAAAELNSSRPTLAFKILTAMVISMAESGADLEKGILGFLEKLKAKRIAQAKTAAGLLKDGDVVLTHCNVSGLMPLIGQFARGQGKRVSFYVTETRPYMQGSRLTAWELMRAGLEVTIITDNMVAYLLAQGRVSKVIVGADHLAQNGDIANKIGTYQIAVVAKYFKIPFYCLCPPVSKLKRGRDIKIEIRPGKELKVYKGLWLAPKEVKAYYPAFDVTPRELISKHIYLEV